jgi:hypothetical protein
MKAQSLTSEHRQKSAPKSAQRIENKERSRKRERERVRRALKIKSMAKNERVKECATP